MFEPLLLLGRRTGGVCVWGVWVLVADRTSATVVPSVPLLGLLKVRS